MKLIEDWRSVWKYYSTHALIITGAIPLAWKSVPLEWKDAFPPDIKPYVPVILAVVCAVSGVIGRVVDQTATPNETQ